MSFPRYPAYKDSRVEWLGQVPTHWSIKKVSHLAHLMVGFPFSSGSFSFDPEAGLPLVRGDNVTEGFLRWGEKGRYWPFDLDYEPRYLLQANDILVSMDGSKVGKNWTLLRKSDLPALLVQRVTRIRVASECTARFVYAQISNEMFIRYVDRTKTDPAIPHITMKNIGDYWVTVPPTGEQEIIVQFLDREVAKIDALVAEQEQLITLLKEKLQAVTSHAVTKGLDPSVPMKDSGVEWLGEVPAHWGVSALSYLSSIETGATPERGEPSYWNGTIPWLKTGEINWEPIREAEEFITEEGLANSAAKLSQPGTLLMAMYGQGVTRGRVALLEIEAAYNQACAAITFGDRVIPKFGRYFFMAAYDHIREGGNETSQMNLSAGLIAKFRLSVPPKVEQEAIVRKLDDELLRSEVLCGEAVKAVTLLQERRSALISAAVTGQIDVRQFGQ
ncbi:MAG: hypothetical protein CFE46_11630 [Burkholderiales bacterium PBB6]|nr:MAG: hypothetical protein CFE46_11630 [Burkholderiales bacterium PBB6]